MITDIEKTIREYLPGVIHMSLATSHDNKPWVCEVHFAYDDELNLYFMSKSTRRHSEEIAENPNVAGNIVRQHAVGEKPRGVYFEGKAEMLTNADTAKDIYFKRFNLDKAPPEHEFYKITVAKYYLFDSLESSPSQKYELIWPKNRKE
jgi:uncharacterized protein YhbP (UPF0306 family)